MGLTGLTVSTLPAWPVFHPTLPLHPLADTLTGVPIVTNVALADRLSTGSGLTVTVLLTKPEQVPTVHVAE
ncbi:hypothetical protein GCM10028807_00300 [Spirosoma daeguense]